MVQQALLVMNCVTLHETLLKVVDNGLDTIAPSSGVSRSIINVAWDKILSGLRRILAHNMPKSGNDQYVLLLDSIMDHVFTHLQSKALPSTVQDEIVNILDQGSSKCSSTHLQEACTRHMFKMMRADQDGTAAVAPIVLRRCMKTLTSFVENSQNGVVESYVEVFGSLKLQELRILSDNGANVVSSGADRSHLLQFFPVLCDCVVALGSTSEEKKVSSGLASLFRTFGSAMDVQRDE